MQQPQQQRYRLVLLLSLLALATHWPPAAATFAGSCYTSLGIEVTTCSEVSSYCTSKSCSSTNGAMQYTCYSPYNCYGSYSPPAVTAPTPSPKASVDYSSNCLDNLDGSVSSCDEAQQALESLGCTCYTCTEDGTNVEFECTSPFQCSDSAYFFGAEEAMTSPEMNSESYAIVCAVYLVVAAALVGSTKGIAYLCYPPVASKEPSMKERLESSLSWPKQQVYGVLAKSVVGDDGSPIGLVDYFFNENELAGILDCRAKTKATRSRWMHVLAVLTALVVTASLASLFGTVVFNNESCVTSRSLNYCHQCDCKTYCNGVDYGCTDACQCLANWGCSSFSCQGASSTVSLDASTSSSTTVCQEADVEYSQVAQVVTMLLTKAMEVAYGMALGTAPDSSPRQKALGYLNLVVAFVLLVFGVTYSSSLAKDQGDSDDDASSRRMEAILQVLWTAWLLDQAVEVGQLVVYAVRRCIYASYYVPQLAQLSTAKPNAGGAVVHPRPERALDDCVLKTELPDGAETVTPSSVVLQDPTGGCRGNDTP